MRIAIFGTGGAGGYFGAQLARAGEDVTFIARELRADSNLLSNGVLTGKNRRAARSLIRTTSGLVAVSRLSNGRPSRIGIFII